MQGAVALLGCGTAGTVADENQAAFVSDCDGSVVERGAVSGEVALVWTGGTSTIYPDDEFTALDFERFATDDGGTLADSSDAFKEAVRGEVARILCEFPSLHVRVENGKSVIGTPATTVHFAQILSPLGGAQIGEGQYDPCDRHDDNAALIFAEELRQLGGPFSFDEWVLMFANVTAHEIAHTLGYGHVRRQEHSDAEHSIYVELMLATHTVDEMLRPQRYMADDSNCPDESTNARRRIENSNPVCTIITSSGSDE